MWSLVNVSCLSVSTESPESSFMFYFDSQGFEDCLVMDEIMDQLNENIGKTEPASQENSSSKHF